MSRRHFFAVSLLFLLSGIAALIYEVLWLKELGLLFGNTTQAMATTLTTFFLGLALGGYYWGRKASHYREPLKLYAALEAAVAVCALGYFGLLTLYGWLYPHVFACCGNAPALFTAVKFGLSLTILLPPAFFIGGTLPVVSHYAAQRPEYLGPNTATLYGVNTLGAVIGAVLAGFYLPAWLGFNASYGLAIAISCIGAAAAYRLSKPVAIPESSRSSRPTIDRRSFRSAAVLSFVSGFSTLALQVLWGRMFAQVLQNSVYTFALILAIFLVCLAAAGFCARWAMNGRFDVERWLYGALIAGALSVNLGPFVFLAWTGNLHYIGSDSGWYRYLADVAVPTALIIAPPLLLLGMVLPLTIGSLQDSAVSAGALVGRLVGINTLGAIVGSIVAGFWLLESIGLWAGIRLIAVIYWLTAAYWFSQTAIKPRHGAYLPALGILLAVSVLDTGKLPVVNVDPVNEEESLLEFWESSAATVAVIRRGEHLKIKVNNHYTLGGTGSKALERLTGALPVALHRQPRSVYVLGLGTGITAGGALDYPIQQLTVTELLADVVVASEKYFGAYTNGLFYDPRARVIHEDGRHYLRGTPERFDVMIGDLFVPWEAGTGSLYSLEHFGNVANHLTENGLFMQWLPAYQLTQRDFDVIARTFLAVFPDATVWRADFSALRPVIGLLGHKTAQHLSTTSPLLTRGETELLKHYVGKLANLKERLATAPLNTDDKPIIEFSAPISQRATKTGQQQWLAGEDWIAMIDLLHETEPDYLAELPERWRQWPTAGRHLQRAQWLHYQGELRQAEQEMTKYRELTENTEH